MIKLFVNHYKKISMVVTVFIIIYTAIYNIYYYKDVQCVRQEVYIEELTESFEGFAILQISDLHGKYFGYNKQYLIDTINSIDYDMIAITSDIANKHTDNIQSFLDIMNGINSKENVFFTFGNADDKKFHIKI